MQAAASARAQKPTNAVPSKSASKALDGRAVDAYDKVWILSHAWSAPAWSWQSMVSAITHFTPAGTVSCVPDSTSESHIA